MDSLRYVGQQSVVLRLILIQSLTAFFTSGLMTSIPLLSTHPNGFNMTVKQVRRREEVVVVVVVIILQPMSPQ